MERRVTTKIENFNVKFKKDIQEWLNTTDCKITKDGQDMSADFSKFIYEYENCILTKEDFQKRKRVKNVVSHFERCSANRADGQQCTRRKRNDSCFCGTHSKGTPHGVNEDTNVDTTSIKNVEVWIQEIMGINYYIDADNNVYKHEDVVTNKTSPDVIAKWELDHDGKYNIPEFMN